MTDLFSESIVRSRLDSGGLQLYCRVAHALAPFRRQASQLNTVTGMCTLENVPFVQ